MRDDNDLIKAARKAASALGVLLGKFDANDGGPEQQVLGAYLTRSEYDTLRGYYLAHLATDGEAKGGRDGS